MNPSLKWVGGKNTIAQSIVGLIDPTHISFIEVFGGSGAILHAKQPSPIEVYNDINEWLVTFFRVIRDDEKVAKLVDLLDWTPYSRVEQKEAEYNFKQRNLNLDEIEIARQMFIASRCSYAGRINGFGYDAKTLRNTVRTMRNAIEAMTGIQKRFQYVTVDCKDFTWILEKYDTEKTVFYLDPPYHPDVISKNDDYIDQMSPEQHSELLYLARQVKGDVILSGYAHPEYDEKLAGWERYTIGTKCHSMKDRKGAKIERQEVIWKKSKTKSIW